MGIFRIVFRNLEHKVRTRLPGDRVPYPAGYRGMLLHEADKCVGCKICAYVCSPGAITFDESGDQHLTWQYFAEQCTFCGRCVDYCPNSALGFARDAPLVTGDRAEHRVAHQVPYHLCARCGKPVLFLPDSLLARPYGEVAPAEVKELCHLCEECRRRVLSERVKRSFVGIKREP
jgi:formate hydrogenlyase subunit 6/NADH:ubiquinone oxidoreductase subunit I